MSKRLCNQQLDQFVYTNKKYPAEYPQELLNALFLVSKNVEKLNIMGSFKQKSLIWSGDIDALEIIPYNEQAQALKNIVNKITSTQGYGTDFYLGDIKCGYNKFRNLKKYIGELKNGQIIGYNPQAIKIEMYNDYDPEFFELLKDKPTIQEWAKFNKFIKSFIALRWTPQEILKGVKIDNGRNIDIDMAIYNSPTTKIDLYYNLYGKYVEITNIIFDKMESSDEFVKTILDGAKINFYNGNLLKCIKNIYSVSRILQDCETLEKIDPLLISPINSLNSCKSDLDVLSNMVDFGFSVSFNHIKVKNHLGTIILKLSSYYLDDIPNSIFNDINELSNIIEVEIFKNRVDKIMDYLNEIIKRRTKEFIDNNITIIKKYII
jgi:hypothetical protein